MTLHQSLELSGRYHALPLFCSKSFKQMSDRERCAPNGNRTKFVEIWILADYVASDPLFIQDWIYRMTMEKETNCIGIKKTNHNRLVQCSRWERVDAWVCG